LKLVLQPDERRVRILSKLKWVTLKCEKLSEIEKAVDAITNQPTQCRPVLFECARNKYEENALELLSNARKKIAKIIIEEVAEGPERKEFYKEFLEEWKNKNTGDRVMLGNVMTLKNKYEFASAFELKLWTNV